MSYVFDSSCLIYFGKLKLLEKIGRLEGRKIIPDSVYQEVVAIGFERKEPESKYIEDLIKKNVFNVAKAGIKIVSAPLLSKSDSDVISVAKKTQSICIIDDLYASRVAKSFGLESHGSIYMIFKLVEKNIISKKEAVSYLNRMVDMGFYLSAGKYKEVLDAIGKMKG